MINTRKIKFKMIDKKNKNIGYEELSSNEQFKYLQYSGLNDSFGNEIYEGDVVQYENFIGDVFFENGRFQVNWHCNSKLLRKDLFVWCCKEDFCVISR